MDFELADDRKARLHRANVTIRLNDKESNRANIYGTADCLLLLLLGPKHMQVSAMMSAPQPDGSSRPGLSSPDNRHICAIILN